MALTPERLAQIEKLHLHAERIGAAWFPEVWFSPHDERRLHLAAAVASLRAAADIITQQTEELAAVIAERDKLASGLRAEMSYVGADLIAASWEEKYKAAQARADRFEQQLATLATALRALPATVSARTTQEPSYMLLADVERVLCSFAPIRPAPVAIT